MTLKTAGERGAGLAPQSRDCRPAGGLLSRSSTLYSKIHKDLKYLKVSRQTILDWWISERGVVSNAIAHLIIHILCGTETASVSSRIITLTLTRAPKQASGGFQQRQYEACTAFGSGACPRQLGLVLTLATPGVPPRTYLPWRGPPKEHGFVENT